MIPKNIQKLIDDKNYQKALIKSQKLNDKETLKEIIDLLIEKKVFSSNRTEMDS